MGYPNTTRVYVAAGEIFGGERFMTPFREMYRVENRSSVARGGELGGIEAKGRGLLGSAVDYLVCLNVRAAGGWGFRVLGF